MRWAGLAPLALCLSAAAAAGSEPGVHDGLVHWLRQSGGQAEVAIRPVAGVSKDWQEWGVFAGRDFRAGDTVIRVPHNLSVTLDDFLLPTPSQVVALMRKRFAEPAWDAALIPFWSALPLPGTLHTKENWDRALTPLLQDEHLGQFVNLFAQWTEKVFTDETSLPQHQSWGSIVQEFPAADDVTFEEFAHLSAVIASSAFAFNDTQGQLRSVLLPLLHLLNHRGHSNVGVQQAADGGYQAQALQDIQAGEELTYYYNHGCERNDYSLVNYGFLTRYEQPLLAHSDRPDTSMFDQVSAQDVYTDEYEPGGKLHTHGELARLEGILGGLPTTEAEDARLLQQRGPDADPWETLILRYRLVRKEALAYHIKKLRAELPPRGAEASGEQEEEEGASEEGHQPEEDPEGAEASVEELLRGGAAAHENHAQDEDEAGHGEHGFLEDSVPLFGLHAEAGHGPGAADAEGGSEGGWEEEGHAEGGASDEEAEAEEERLLLLEEEAEGLSHWDRHGGEEL